MYIKKGSTDNRTSRTRIKKRKKYILISLIVFAAISSITYAGIQYFNKSSNQNKISENTNPTGNTNSTGNTNIKTPEKQTEPGKDTKTDSSAGNNAGVKTEPDNDSKAESNENTENANNGEKVTQPESNTGTDSNKSTPADEVKTTDPSKVNIYNSDGTKTAYITFDDGPSAGITPEILNILDRYNVKATFFIIGSMAVKNPDMVKLEFEKGHAIGNHTYSHNYSIVYSNTAAFIGDVNKCDTVLKSILGDQFNSKLFRFPGGSFGTSREPFREAIASAGYHYIDWNDITGDAEGQNIPVDKLISNLRMYTENKQHVVILMHDAPGKNTTVQALPQVIEYLKAQGYSFAKLK